LHADVVTSGMVLAKMLAMNWQCSFSRYSEDAMSLWQLTMQQSLFGRALGVLPSLSVFFSIGWLMMGMQWLYALAMTVPRRVFKEFTNIETKFHYRLRESVDGAFQYQTLANPRTDVGDTVMVLSETCRMATVTFQESTYFKQAVMKDHLGAFGYVDYKMKRSVLKMICFLLAESAV